MMFIKEGAIVTKLDRAIEAGRELTAKITTETVDLPDKQKSRYLLDFKKIVSNRKNISGNTEYINEQLELLLAYIKAEKFIAGNRIDPLKFEFQEDERKTQMAAIMNDMQTANKLQEKFEGTEITETQKYSKVLEAIVAQYIGNGWLGENVTSKNTSLFDDFTNQVDVIAELEKEGGYKKYLGLAIDATFSNKLEEKFNAIKSKITRGELGQLRYYKTDGFQGRLSQLPEVVVGVEISQLRELVNLWSNGNVEELKKHPVQFQILGEILMQVIAFSEYVKLIPEANMDQKKREEIIKIYDRLKETIGSLITERGKEILKQPINDSLFFQIKDICQKFGKNHERIKSEVQI